MGPATQGHHHPRQSERRIDGWPSSVPHSRRTPEVGKHNLARFAHKPGKKRETNPVSWLFNEGCATYPSIQAGRPQGLHHEHMHAWPVAARRTFADKWCFARRKAGEQTTASSQGRGGAVEPAHQRGKMGPAVPALIPLACTISGQGPSSTSQEDVGVFPTPAARFAP